MDGGTFYIVISNEQKYIWSATNTLKVITKAPIFNDYSYCVLVSNFYGISPVIISNTNRIITSSTILKILRSFKLSKPS
jgi:hypothetical protein